MAARIKWVERKFSFDSPAGMYPYILERLGGVSPRVEEIVKKLPEEKLTSRVNNSWSIKEHIGHITDLEALHDKRLDQLLERAEILLPADMTNEKTYLAEHNKTRIDALLSNLRESRLHFTSRLEKLDEQQILISALHTRLDKQMRVIDLASFVAEHDDHHITIIREIAETNK